MRTTLDLDLALIIKNMNIIDVKSILDENKIFSKIYPAPKSVLESCSPILVVSSKDEIKVKDILEGILYEKIKMDKDIIWELLKR
ncbi:hypothetical protein OSSY52_00880 [Tepiditoga spiralis]|uniref:Uncharacterized protein n=1 Tax=Tepiditoga spiralis TaxID=2108365 RepID=A0A7G1G4Y6_9BACT|nr:hypothetical protein [Tepiditoga spiralis]BBE29947.1 hypothetical protein OSSY52_00880 [Tepiditoga spiralis]